MSEHRHHPRLHFEASVRVELEGLVLEARTRDLTMTGLSVRVDEALPEDARCQVDIRLGDGAEELHIRGQARVVHAEREADGAAFDVGLAFETLEDSAQEMLWQLLRHNRATGTTRR